MTTWAEVRDRISAVHGLDLDEPDEIACTLHRQAGDVRRAQRVMLSKYRAFDTDMLECRSAFGHARDFDISELLTEALRLPIGGIAEHGGYLVLLQKIALEDTTTEAVLKLVERISTLADVLESRSGDDRF
ncbi:MAG: hypothetical protein EA397_15535 [Deltaproteobacteria bacterium]|nr:MAG: hypothetical protein EA397_15535 [Deltaproteobacteria bacterium]